MCLHRVWGEKEFQLGIQGGMLIYWGCFSKILKPQKWILRWFWRLEVWSSGVGRTVRGAWSTLPPSFWGLPSVLGSPWLADTSFQSLPLSSQGTLSLCLCIFYKGMDYRPTSLQYNLILTNHTYNNPISKYGYHLRYCVRTQSFGEDKVGDSCSVMPDSLQPHGL